MPKGWAEWLSLSSRLSHRPTTTTLIVIIFIIIIVITSIITTENITIIIITGTSTQKLKEVVIHCAQGELVGLTLVVPIKVNKLEISAVIDTAAEATILSRTVFEKLRMKPCIIEEINLKGLNEDEPVKGQLINANLTIGSKTYKWDVYVTETSDQCLLGLDILYHH